MTPDIKAPIGDLQSPQVEQLLKEAAESNVISFAGALPSSAIFPSGELKEAFARTMADHSGEALQYNWCEGYAPLREQISELMHNRGIPTKPDEILVTHGAQQALSLISKLLLVNPGDGAALESPTYAAAIQALMLQSPRLLPIERSLDRFDFERLDEILRSESPKFLYVIPTGHNPIGGLLRGAERLKLIEMTANSGCVVIEDDAYGELQYDRIEHPLKGRSNTDHVFYVGSFSKILSPGLRIGWIAASVNVIAELSKLKQATDLQTGSLNQLMLSAYLAKHPLRHHIERCIPFYRQRRDAMAAALQQHLSPYAKWSVPAGGFSVWVELRGELSAEELLPKAIERGVAFDPGRVNFPSELKANYMRLSFSNQEPRRIEEGVALLGELLSSAT